MRRTLFFSSLLASLTLASASIVETAEAKTPRRDRIVGGGYAAFESNGSPGDNSYWVFAREKRNGSPAGQWYADVLIEFPGFTYSFEALYSVDCIEVDYTTGTAWIDGTVIDSPDPDNIGLRAFLWIRDGSFTPNGKDAHAITPIPDGSEIHCKQRPEPDFMESITSGNYIIKRR